MRHAGFGGGEAFDGAAAVGALPEDAEVLVPIRLKRNDSGKQITSAPRRPASATADVAGRTDSSGAAGTRIFGDTHCAHSGRS